MGTVELERLQISTANTHYDLRFNRFRAIQIVGDSGTGKTMLGTIVRALGNELEFGNGKALVVDTLHTEGITEIRLNHSEYSLIILDNADLEYTNEVLDIMRNDILSKESNTYWVVIGRRFHSCCPTGLSSAALKMEVDKATKTCKIWNEFVDDARMSYYANKERKFL